MNETVKVQKIKTLFGRCKNEYIELCFKNILAARYTQNFTVFVIDLFLVLFSSYLIWNEFITIGNR